jgi:GTP-binding protein
MNVSEADFIKSSVDLKQCPAPNIPEYAFIGRSNVGKSSLINMLVNRKNLAKTSSTPGKTQHINHFKINSTWYLVDLPGYGYARVARKSKALWENFVGDYLCQRENLQCVFILLDLRHELQENDEIFFEYCGKWEIPFSIIYTKSDKLKPGELEKNIKKIEDKILESWEVLPATFITSASKNRGRDEVLNFIDSVNQKFEF